MALKDKLNEAAFNSVNYDDMAEVLDDIEEAIGQGGGGSGLPTPTAEDVGKTMVVVENTETVKGDVIVPEQVIDFEGANLTLTDANVSLFTEGTTVIVTINGTEYNGTIESSGGGLVLWIEDDSYQYRFFTDDDDIKFSTSNANGEYSVSVNVTATETSYEWSPTGTVLPEPTAEDVGKTMVVTEKAVAGDVIVPEQSGTLDNNNNFTCVNANAELFTGDTEVIAVVNGNTYTATIIDFDDAVYVEFGSEYGFELHDNSIIFYTDPDHHSTGEEFTVSLNVGDVSYEWSKGNVGGGLTLYGPYLFTVDPNDAITVASGSTGYAPLLSIFDTSDNYHTLTGVTDAKFLLTYYESRVPIITVKPPLWNGGTLMDANVYIFNTSSESVSISEFDVYATFYSTVELPLAE